MRRRAQRHGACKTFSSKPARLAGRITRSTIGATTMTTNAQTEQAPVRFTLHIPNNNDNGSLKVGQSAGTKIWDKGDKIQIEGEGDKVRTVTFVMGSGEKTHLCFAKQGPIAKGPVSYRIVSAETATPPVDASTRANQIAALSQSNPEMTLAELEAATAPETQAA